MILDARDPDVMLDRPTDLAIVGAGPAGLVLARELAAIAPVTLIESGGIDTDPQINDLQQGETIGLDYPLTETRARGFGGSASLWAGYCARFDSHDFTERPWVTGSGWPFGAKALEPYYPRVAELLNLHDANFDARDIAVRAGIPLPFDHCRVAPTVWRFGTPIQRFAGPFQQACSSASAISILTHATVVDLRLNAGHDTVTELVLRTLNGRQGNIRPKMVVLACGGLETPRILLNANSQLPGGVGNDNGLLGRYFMEHPHVAIKPFELLRPDLFEHWAERGGYDDGLQYLSCLGLSPEMQQTLGVLNARLHLYRTPSMAGDATPCAGLFMEQAPNPQSRVTLSDKRDALGMRRLCLDWQLSELDRHTFEQTAQALSAEFVKRDWGRLDGPIRVDHHTDLAPLYSNHHLGTTRMAASRSNGVVDQNCRVHDISNLYVAGGSVFPTVSWANPTFTLMALTYRLADHLRTRLQPGSVCTYSKAAPLPVNHSQTRE